MAATFHDGVGDPRHHLANSFGEEVASSFLLAILLANERAVGLLIFERHGSWLWRRSRGKRAKMRTKKEKICLMIKQ